MATFFSVLSEWTVWDYLAGVVDVAILAFVIYQVILLINGTRAVQLIKGLAILALVAGVAGWAGLHAVSWLLNQLWSVIFLALAVIFQPELRRALERLGRGDLLHDGDLSAGDLVHLIDQIVATCIACSKTKTGALIVLERGIGLSDYIESGIAIDARVTQELLCNVFVVNTPLHDGAAIIRGDRLAAAACFLPLSDNPYISMSLGTRHRAGIGVSEVSDAVVLIVSEETGTVSVAQDGKLIRNLDEKQMREILSRELGHTGAKPTDLLQEAKGLAFWRKGGGADGDK